ncbi:MAG: thioredoxin-disulfide reductase [Nanoarchaeota archaeon]
MAEKMRDVIIIGGGISAHTAALYTARASLKPFVISGAEPDQLSMTTLVENYPGFPEGIMGPDLIVHCKQQAQKFGAEYLEENVTSFKKIKQGFDISVGKKTFHARTVVISTGASARLLNIPGEKTYFGRGVSTCAVCDAALYRNKIAVVIGGGDSAMEETLALVKFATKVYLIHRKDSFRASKIMQDRVMKMKGKVDVILNTEVLEVKGNKFVESIKIKNNGTGKISELKTDGLFLAIGHIPNTILFKDIVRLDEQGYVLTDKLGKTNVEGLYAAGDVQDSVFKQAITSAGTGCMAALNVERYLEHLKAEGTY